MDISGLSSLAAASKFQFAVASKVLDVAKDSGEASISLLQSAAKVARAGSESAEKSITDALQGLDIYA